MQILKQADFWNDQNNKGTNLLGIMTRRRWFCWIQRVLAV